MLGSRGALPRAGWAVGAPGLLEQGGHHAARIGPGAPASDRKRGRGQAAVAFFRAAGGSGRRVVRKRIRAEVLDAASAVETAGQRIEAARSGREAAEVQLEAERDRYDGLSTNFLILTRQNDLSRARLDEITALTDYRTARAELARATGQSKSAASTSTDPLDGRPPCEGD